MATVDIIASGGGKIDAAAAQVNATTAVSGLVGDLVIGWSVCERATGKAVVSGGTGAWTEATVQVGANHVLAVYWKHLGSGDTSFTPQANSVLISGGTSTTRRMGVNFVHLRGGQVPVFVTRTAVGTGGGGTTTHLGADATPAAADARLLGLVGTVAINAPFERTYTGYAAGWTEVRQLTGASTTLTNPGSAMFTKQLTGQAGVLQTAGSATYSSAAENTGLTIVVPAGTVNQSPLAGISAAKNTVEPGEATVLTLTESDDVAVTTRTFRQVSGPTATVSGTGLSRTITAPYTVPGGTMVFGYQVGDGSLTSPEATVNVSVLPSEWRIQKAGVEIPLKVITAV
jgi:hypothetical protein